MRAKQHATRKVNKLKEEIAKLEEQFFSHEPTDIDSEVFSLEQKKQHLIRAKILDLHLSIEDLLTTLIICAVAAPSRSKRKFPRRWIKPELWDLMEGERALGFSAKVNLARSLGILSPKVFEKLKKLNRTRNNASHHWQLHIGAKRKVKRHNLRKPLLGYEGGTLMKLENFERFLGEYTAVYLRLWLRVTDYR